LHFVSYSRFIVVECRTHLAKGETKVEETTATIATGARTIAYETTADSIKQSISILLEAHSERFQPKQQRHRSA
jgi:hypothetical protein